MEKIGIGIVGLGMIATGVHLPGIQKCPDLELKAICDTDPEAVKAAQALYGIDDAHCFTDFKDLINCPEVDAVDICTPNYLHFPVAKYAIEAGKPYNLEKPVVTASSPHPKEFSWIRSRSSLVLTKLAAAYRRE